MTIESVIGFINATMAPAVLLTGVGLLLAGLQNKYSTLASVIRQLCSDRRHLKQEANTDQDSRKIDILSQQLDSLMQRAKLIRNAIFCFYTTVFFLVASSIVLGLNQLNLMASSTMIFVVFSVALGFLFSGLIFATREALLSYRIVQLETSL